MQRAQRAAAITVARKFYVSRQNRRMKIELHTYNMSHRIGLRGLNVYVTAWSISNLNVEKISKAGIKVFLEKNEWSQYFDIRPHCRHTRTVQSYSPGCVSVHSHASLGQSESTSQTASRTVRPFLAGLTIVTDRQTDRQTNHAIPVCNNSPHLHITAMRACGLIIPNVRRFYGHRCLANSFLRVYDAVLYRA